MWKHTIIPSSLAPSLLLSSAQEHLSLLLGMNKERQCLLLPVGIWDPKYVPYVHGGISLSGHFALVTHAQRKFQMHKPQTNSQPFPPMQLILLSTIWYAIIVPNWNLSLHFHRDLRGPRHLEYIPIFEKALLELKSFRRVKYPNVKTSQRYKITHVHLNNGKCAWAVTRM